MLDRRWTNDRHLTDLTIITARETVVLNKAVESVDTRSAASCDRLLNCAQQHTRHGAGMARSCQLQRLFKLEAKSNGHVLSAVIEEVNWNTGKTQFSACLGFFGTGLPGTVSLPKRLHWVLWQLAFGAT